MKINWYALFTNQMNKEKDNSSPIDTPYCRKQEKEKLFTQELKEMTRYASLREKYSARLNQTRQTLVMPANKYMAIRVDGVSLRKYYLNDQLNNELFSMAMTASVRATYKMLQRRSPTNSQQVFLGAMHGQDEAIFIINTNPNYFGRNVNRLASVVTSAFTSVFTSINPKICASENAQPFIGIFDGEPVILNDINEVVEYTGYRAASCARYQICKEIGLNGTALSAEESNREFTNIRHLAAKLKKPMEDIDRINNYFKTYTINEQDPTRVKMSSCGNFEYLIYHSHRHLRITQKFIDHTNLIPRKL
ncbi:tRNA(His) guanylyltransferase Thg1 family protein [Photobacterium leiognathi]|uniref:tRNA(His) guanylyltransferase Thg1 family protein n=1 Tax=Photobacterium leiognathi TaxID=553611 RepID=UPI00298162A2|nr:tRNA(His) guanylyltransferase Thg1 family protein [Photobacterium leiognathi]